jgi:transposase-like protein
MTIDQDTLAKLLEGVDLTDPQALLGDNGVFQQLKKAIAERALNAELTHHLTNEPARAGKHNHRNGSSKKTVLTGDGEMELAIPRDRAGTFEPQLIAKHQRRLPGFDDKVISMYARGMTVREIQGHLAELYGIEVSPDLISTVTDAVWEEVVEWQNRPLDRMYPIVFFDALRVKIRDEGTVRNKAVYLALGVDCDGGKHILGLWIEQTEGAKFWLKVMTELKNRGLEDILVSVVDGLKGFPEAITAVFPQTQVQTCIVHLIRNSLEYCGWQERKAFAAALKGVYTAVSEAEAEQRLAELEAGPWGRKFPPVMQSWRRHWEQIVPFFAFPPEVRRIIYTTNAIESLNMRLRKVIKNRGHFPNDEAATKLLFLALRNIEKNWKMPPVTWRATRNQFAILFGERFLESAY